VDAAVTITLGLLRVLIALIPVALFVLLPLALLVRYIIRRARRRAPPAEQLP
jgi:membrane protein implicated in regulation of membrane protease activity